MKKKKQKKIEPVNCRDEQEMISLGYRNPLVPRDKSVWTKTPKEKAVLKRVKRLFKNYEFGSSWGFHKRAIPCYGKLRVEIYKNANFCKRNGYPVSHLTYVFNCGQSDIPYLLSKFIIRNKKDETINLVRRYKWNGQYYSPDTLPFYYW